MAQGHMVLASGSPGGLHCLKGPLEISGHAAECCVNGEGGTTGTGWAQGLRGQGSAMCQSACGLPTVLQTLRAAADSL